MWKAMQPGLVVKLAATDMVKLVPAVMAEMKGSCGVVLQVTPRSEPLLASKVRLISDLALTAVVLTTMAKEPAAMATNPSMLAPKAAGEDEEKHCVSVFSELVVMAP